MPVAVYFSIGLVILFHFELISAQNQLKQDNLKCSVGSNRFLFGSKSQSSTFCEIRPDLGDYCTAKWALVIDGPDSSINANDSIIKENNSSHDGISIENRFDCRSMNRSRNQTISDQSSNNDEYAVEITVEHTNLEGADNADIRIWAEISCSDSDFCNQHALKTIYEQTNLCSSNSSANLQIDQSISIIRSLLINNFENRIDQQSLLTCRCGVPDNTEGDFSGAYGCQEITNQCSLPKRNSSIFYDHDRSTANTNFVQPACVMAFSSKNHADQSEPHYLCALSDVRGDVYLRSTIDRSKNSIDFLGVCRSNDQCNDEDNFGKLFCAVFDLILEKDIVSQMENHDKQNGTRPDPESMASKACDRKVSLFQFAFLIILILIKV